MFSQQINEVMARESLLTASADISISQAAKLMADKQVGAVVVIEQKKLLGIFTERDAVFRVIACGLDPQTTRLSDVMTTAPKTVSPNKSFGYALLLMHENGCRHLPVLEQGELVGIVTSRNVLDPDLEEFLSESQRRTQILRERT